jgi:UDP-2,3-diacylglucosamine pyrophosphatase LpxH
MSRQLIRLVVSDLHLGTGSARGRFNPLEDFHEDDRFAELLDHYTSGSYRDHEVELVLAGDVFDLLKVPLDGTVPAEVTEEMAARKVLLCLEGHPVLCDAIVRFLERSANRIVYIPGNHDIEMLLPLVQETFLERCAPGDLAERVTFLTRSDTYYLPEGIQIRHGHQLEAVNHFDYDNLLVHRPSGPPVVNYPWGSLFSLRVILPNKKHRYHLDHVHPFSRYLQLSLFTDFWFTLQILFRIVTFFFRTRLFETWRSQAGLRATWRAIRSELSWVGNFDEIVAKWVRRTRGADIFITGHSHEPRVKQLPGGRLYLNTGTWTKMLNLDLFHLGQETGLTYVSIEYDEEGRPLANLMRWQGKPRIKDVVKYEH